MCQVAHYRDSRCSGARAPSVPAGGRVKPLRAVWCVGAIEARHLLVVQAAVIAGRWFAGLTLEWRGPRAPGPLVLSPVPLLIADHIALTPVAWSTGFRLDVHRTQRLTTKVHSLRATAAAELVVAIAAVHERVPAKVATTRRNSRTVLRVSGAGCACIAVNSSVIGTGAPSTSATGR